MRIAIKNQFHKGDTLPVLVTEDGRIVLKSVKSGNTMDITELLDQSELPYIRRVGRGIAVVESKEYMNLAYCCNYHTHSQYSVLDGMNKLSDIAKLSSGVTAITDHGNMFALLKWQNAMEKAGKKPIFGFEAYVEDVVSGEKSGSHLILLAKNEEGLKNAYKLTSIAYNNYYRKPHVSVEMLKTYHNGLVCTSACIGGELAKTIRKDYEKARQIVKFYKSLFQDDYYIEIQRHWIDGEQEINNLLIKLAKEESVKIVCANDSHYTQEGDGNTHRILLALSFRKTLKDIDGFEGTGYHFKSDKEMINDFWDIPEAVANTLEIAEKCNVKVETGVYHMPVFPFPEGYKDDNEYLMSLIDEGFKERYGEKPEESNPEYTERLAYEKSAILNMGFSSYFLIVWDYVAWAKKNGILVGPGRGSGAGSLCLYCLHITEVDPIKNGLKFERFLNPDRISMPDIDVDFEDSRRQEVIEYVRGRYGDDRVCNIITFGTMQAKNAIRDISRVNDFAPSFAGNICNKINPKAKNLKGSIEGDDASSELVELINSDASVKEIVSEALVLEGNPRQTGIHACGVVVADAPVLNYLPTAMVKDSKAKNKESKLLCSQVTMAEVEEMGLLKMDVRIVR